MRNYHVERGLARGLFGVPLYSISVEVEGGIGFSFFVREAAFSFFKKEVLASCVEEINVSTPQRILNLLLDSCDRW